MADIVQADYEALTAAAKQFSQQSNKIRQMHGKLHRKVNSLRTSWIGKGSNAFFAEMSDKVLPAVLRLSAALAEADSVTKKIAEILQGAEEQGSSPFRQEADGGGGGLGLGGAGAGGDGAGGVWGEDSFLPGDFADSLLEQVRQDFGFSGGAPEGAGGLPDYAVPEDWLSGVDPGEASPWSGGQAEGLGDAGELGELGGAGSGGGETGGGGSGGGETGGGSGSGGGETGGGSGSSGGGSPTGGSPTGAEKPAGEQVAAVPGPLRYAPIGGGGQAASAPAAAGQTWGAGAGGAAAPQQAAQAGMGLPMGLAALGPLVALVGKAVKERSSGR